MTTTLKIEGMSCGHCVKHVKDALEEINGVKGAEVSLDNNEALVEHEGGVTLEMMTQAVEDAGYTVK